VGESGRNIHVLTLLITFYVLGCKIKSEVERGCKVELVISHVP